jgi:hypothetical protein
MLTLPRWHGSRPPAPPAPAEGTSCTTCLLPHCPLSLAGCWGAHASLASRCGFGQHCCCCVKTNVGAEPDAAVACVQFCAH